MSFVLAILTATCIQTDQSEEPGIQYARNLARVVRQVEKEHEECVTQKELETLEKKLDALVDEIRQLRALLDQLDQCTQQPQVDARYLKYSQAFVRNYDVNGDEVLTKDEWSKMTVDYSEADTNHDGRITATEMALLLMKRSDK